jgi:hypothetical protein
MSNLQGSSIPIHRIFLYIFLYFAKINGPLEILQNYKNAAVTHGGWSPTAVRHGGTHGRIQWVV